MKRVGDILGTPAEPEEGHKPASVPTRAALHNSPQSSIRNPQSDELCPICLGRGFLVYDVPVGHPDFGKVVPCRCTQAWLADERCGFTQVQQSGRLGRMTFDSFQPNGVPSCAMTLRGLRTSLGFAGPAGWLVLQGGYGCGKTHLAAAIANYCIALGRPALFVIVPDLLDHLRATFSPNSDTGLDERLSDIRDAPLLILDDLGAHHSTPWAQEKLFQILNHRYNQPPADGHHVEPAP